MRIGIIGCGRVGVTLGYMLKDRHRMIGAHDLDPRREARACRILGLKRNPAYRQMIKESEVLFFATPDDEIVKAYSQAAKFMGPAPRYVFHFSGLLPAETFPKKTGVHRASAHPFATFPRLTRPASGQTFFLSVQGDDKALAAARRIFTKDRFRIRRIRRSEKGYYHLLAVFASNLTVALYDLTCRLAKKIRWKKKDTDAMIFSIIEDTVDNIKKYGAKNALSGPVKRADVNTVRRHIRLLKKQPALLGTYALLSQELLKYASPGKRASLKKALSSDSG
jgi:predicted short-subunit dehydrogenase-like oxidoreductase (DUF2520 family)